MDGETYDIAAPAAAQRARRSQIRPALRDALALIVTEGRSISDAAKAAGLARETLSKALKKPHVQEAKAGIAHAWRTSRTEKALVTIADLSVKATSEDVRLKAARSWLEIVGELGPNRRDDAPRAGQLVQIVVNSGSERSSIDVNRLNPNGVFESEPFLPNSFFDPEDE